MHGLCWIKHLTVQKNPAKCLQVQRALLQFVRYCNLFKGIKFKSTDRCFTREVTAEDLHASKLFSKHTAGKQLDFCGVQVCTGIIAEAAMYLFIKLTKHLDSEGSCAYFGSLLLGQCQQIQFLSCNVIISRMPMSFV
jgi:hypothetical protein